MHITDAYKRVLYILKRNDCL